MRPSLSSQWRNLALLYLASQSLAIDLAIESSNITPGQPFQISWETVMATPGKVTLRDISTGTTTALAAIGDMQQTTSIFWDVPSSMSPGPYTIHITTGLDGEVESQEIKIAVADSSNDHELRIRNAAHRLFARDDNKNGAVSRLNDLSPGASAGVITGIVIGVILIIAASIYCCCWPCCFGKNKRAKRANRFSNHESSVAINNTGVVQDDGSSPWPEQSMETGNVQRQQPAPEVPHGAPPTEPPPAYHEVK